MLLLTVVTTINTSKIVLIIYSLILFKAEQVFKKIYNFINEFMFYNIPSLKVYISNQGAGFVLAIKKFVEEDIQMQLYKQYVAKNIKAILVNSSYNKKKQKPLKKLMWKYIKLKNSVELKANYTVFIY